MTRATRTIGSWVGVLALAAALASPCPCPAQRAMASAGHGCCAPQAGVRAAEPGCCDEQPATPDVSTLQAAAAGLASAAPVALVPAPFERLAPGFRRSVVLALTPPAATLRL